MYRLLKPGLQRASDFFLEKYIPDLDSWRPILLSGLSPHSPGEAEAIKRQLILNGLADLQQMETWYWDAERIEEAMSIPIESPAGGAIALPQNVGLGFHLFRKTDKKGKDIDTLYADVEDSTSSILPMAMIIGPDGVKSIHHIEKNDLPEAPTVAPYTYFRTSDGGSYVLASVPVPKDDPWFMLAAKMTCFLNQKLTDVEKVKALARPDRKRVGIDSPEGQTEVNLVRWRKVRSESDGEGKMLRDKCWPVMGHFRWQWYPGEGVHRLIWIDTHIRGNPSAPLQVKTRVNTVVN